MKLQRKPNPILYFIGSTVVRVINKLKHNIKISGPRPKGPALILANHASFEDWKFIISACGLRRVTFMCTYHFFTFKFLAFWLRLAGIVPKYQFATDLTSMKKIKYVAQHNGIIYVAPEGTVYANGKLGYISEATAKLVRFLNVPVYACKIEGAGLGCAKWSAVKHRNRISVTTSLLLNKDDISELSISDIHKRIIDALQYNEYDYQRKNNLQIKAKDLAEHIETMFYKCPVCGREFTLSSNGNTVRCSHCNAEAEIQKDFSFKWNTEKKYFDNYIDWYDWQYNCLKEQIIKPDFVLSEEMDFAIDKNGVNNYIKVGHGILTLSHSGWDYDGTFEGQPFKDHDDLNAVFLATLNCGKHFELPFKNGHCRVFYPKDGNRAMLWHLASRAMTELLSENRI